jgi:FKBP-type peptidyl-prolyl cis-trans isomerase (trigger factor)
VKENFDLESVDAFKQEIRDSITAQNEQLAPNFKENKAAFEIAERLQGEAPDNVV